MADYIDREAAIDALRDAYGDSYRAEDYIRAIPAADVVKVVHASWIWNPDGMDWGIGAWVCGKCKSRPETWWNNVKECHPLRCSGSRYCGNCGADMREQETKPEPAPGPYDLLHEEGGWNLQ